MPRGRSPPSSKYLRKRPYYTTSSNIKRPGPVGRQMRSLSRSPHRGRSPPRHRVLPSHHSGSPKHDRSISNSRFSGRPFSRPSRSAIKRSRSPIHRRHSLSPPRKSSVRKPSPSPPRKSPIGSKHHSVSPSLRRKPADERNGSPRRMDVTCHRDASHPISSGTTKGDYTSPKSSRRSLSPILRKKEPPHSPAQRRNSNVNEARTKDDKYRGGRDFMNSDRGHSDEFLDRHMDQPGNSHIFRSNRIDKYGSKDSSHGRNISPFDRDSRSDARRYSEGHFEGTNYQHDVFHKRSSENDPGYTSRDSKQTLDDHYRNDEEMRSFSPEELKKITVDIRRNIPRDNETIIRRIVNPDDVLIVRRPGEGARPIFDRDEIKQGILEQEYLEKRVVAIVPERRSRSHSPDDRISSLSRSGDYHENFKIHRDKYPSYEHDGFQSRQRLSDRWQQDRREKFGSNQNEKLLVSVRSRSPQIPHGEYRSPEDGDGYRSSISSSRYNTYYDSDIRNSKYDSEDRNRDYDSNRRPLPTNPNDLRHSLLSRGRPFDVVDARQRILERREKDREPFHRIDSRDSEYDSRRFSDERLRPGTLPHFQQDKYRDKWEGSPSGGSDAKLPNFSTRPDRYQYKEWIDKPDMVPKGPSYFEHDTRGESEFDFSRRGRGRGGVRGFIRGSSFRGRGTFRGRGRGVFIMNRGKHQTSSTKNLHLKKEERTWI